jgi:F0F1-type ATP synthase assembly protein I
MKKKGRNKKKQPYHSLARFSNLAFEMLGIMLIGILIGIKLDQWIGLQPILTAVFTIISVFGALYYAIKASNNSRNN